MRKYFALFFVLLSGGAAFACGPFFPPSWLAEGKNPYLPHFDNNYDLALIGRHFFPWSSSLTPPVSSVSTIEAERTDFRAACKAAGMSPGRTEAELEKFLAFRLAAMDGNAPTVKIPSAPMGEFYLYARGLSELKRSPGLFRPGTTPVKSADELLRPSGAVPPWLDFGWAPPAWRELLRLPLKERTFRPAWVLYMMGNLSAPADADRAFLYYQALRLKVACGAPDTAGLAAASYRSNYLYAPDAVGSIKYLSLGLAVKVGDESHPHVAGDFNPTMRRFVEDAGKDPSLWGRMLADPVCRETCLHYNPRLTIEKLGSSDVFARLKFLSADRVAWRLYSSGDDDLCWKALARAPEDSLIRLFLEARRARRDGDAAGAAGKLRKWLEVFQKSRKEPEAVWFSIDGEAASFPQVIHGELGLTRVEEKDFEEALYSFYTAAATTPPELLTGVPQFWADVALVAERLVGLDTLVKFCEAHCVGDGETAKNLRHLLARRLMREGRQGEAGKFFPEDVRPLWERCTGLLSATGGGKLKGDELGVAFFNLGKLLSSRGDKLFATELEPDFYAAEECMFGFYSLSGSKYVEGRAGVKLSAVPEGRWHYRLRAADAFLGVAREAKSPDIKAAALFLAGVTLKDRDKKKADACYKALCGLRPHPLAEAASSRRWFPPGPEDLVMELKDDTPRTAGEISALSRGKKSGE